MSDPRLEYITLALTPGIGAARLRALLDACETPYGARTAPFAFLCSIPGMSRAAATAVRASSPDDAAAVVARADALGAQVLLPEDAAFPAQLREIPDPPTLLFALGDLALVQRPVVAVVGSRDHSAYGATVCRQLVSDAVAAGLVVVSGMARGLDAVAHLQALELDGGTIGVLGNGLGVVYPAANRSLYEQVVRSGLLLTEFPPGDRPTVGSFPRRNRLISGLATATIVVEAAIGSGALITADAALEQGREVLAVPGPITSRVSTGVNRLIRDGAAPYLEPEDLLRHYPGRVPAEARGPAPLPSPPAVSEPRPVPADLSEADRAIVALLGGAPVHLDDLAARVSVPVAELLGRLCSLEIAGVVEQRPGRMFRRV